MAILPVSGLTNYSLKQLNFNGASNNTVQNSNKQVTLKDIPYSYPICFTGNADTAKVNREKSEWAKQVFEAVGIQAEIDPKDNLLVISEFKEPNGAIKFSDYGIKVSDLLENVKEVEGSFDLSFHKFDEPLVIPNLKIICGNLDLEKSKNIIFSNLEKVCNIDCSSAESIDFSKLKEAHNIDFKNGIDIQFSELEKANDINCSAAQRIDFSKLKEAHNIYCWNGRDIKFSELEKANDIDCLSAQRIDFSKLKEAHNIDFKNGIDIQFSELEKANDINCSAAQRIDFSKLKEAHNIKCLNGVDIEFPELTQINGNFVLGAVIVIPKLKCIKDCFTSYDVREAFLEKFILEHPALEFIGSVFGNTTATASEIEEILARRNKLLTLSQKAGFVNQS